MRATGARDRARSAAPQSERLRNGLSYVTFSCSAGTSPSSSGSSLRSTSRPGGRARDLREHRSRAAEAERGLVSAPRLLIARRGARERTAPDPREGQATDRTAKCRGRRCCSAGAKDVESYDIAAASIASSQRSSNTTDRSSIACSRSTARGEPLPPSRGERSGATRVGAYSNVTAIAACARLKCARRGPRIRRRSSRRCSQAIGHARGTRDAVQGERRSPRRSRWARRWRGSPHP